MGTQIRQYNVQQLVRWVDTRHVAIPEFQRGFVWKTKQVKDLFDSITKQYPIGSFILWETTKAIDARTLDGEKLPRRKCLVLDGQQRLASIYYLSRQKKFVQPHIKDKFHENCDSRPRDVIDFEKFYIDRGDNGPQLEYGRESSCELDPRRLFRLAKRNYKIPVVLISLESYRQAIQVFERINQAGTRISTETIFLSETWNRQSQISRLLRAWKRANKNSLTSMVDIIIFIHSFAVVKQLGEKGRGTVGIGVKELKRIADEIRDGDGGRHKRMFEEVIRSIARAITYLKEEYQIANLGALPSQTMITVLSVFFYFQRKAPSALQRRELRKWFWRSSLQNRYIGAGYAQNINSDVRQMRASR